MIPVLALGAAGMQEAEDAATKYGLTLSGANVDAIRTYGFAQKDFQESTTGLTLAIGNMLIPVLTTLATGLASDAQAINQNAIPAVDRFANQVSHDADIYQGGLWRDCQGAR